MLWRDEEMKKFKYYMAYTVIYYAMTFEPKTVELCKNMH